MAKTHPVDVLARRILASARIRFGGSQAFFFNGDGEPFWAARIPVTEAEVALFAEAIDLIQALEARTPKPFIGHDQDGRFSVLGFSEQSNLYLACLNSGPDRVAAEQRLLALRDEHRSSVAQIENILAAP